MKGCFYGNTGHGLTALLAKDKLPQADFTACCSSFAGEKMNKLIQFAGTVGCHLNEYSNLSEMLHAEKPDILVVDNRFAEHVHAEKMALSLGIHVYTDKPVATTIEELDELRCCAEKTGTHLWAMHTTRYDPWYHTAKLLVQQGAIGKVRMVNCQKSYRLGVRPSFYSDRKTYGGTILWVAIHAIDMIRMVTGNEFISVYSTQSVSDNKGNGEMEIITAANFEMENEILATITTDYYRPAGAHSHDDDRLRIVGTEGIIEVARHEGEHEVHLLNDTDKGFLPVQQIKPPLIFEDFVHTIEGYGSGILNMHETMQNAAAAIYAQKSADMKTIIRFDDEKKD